MLNSITHASNDERGVYSTRKLQTSEKSRAKAWSDSSALASAAS